MAQLSSLPALRMARGYDKAVGRLAELRDLAEHHGLRTAFDARMQRVVAPYAGSAALLRRLWERHISE